MHSRVIGKLQSCGRGLLSRVEAAVLIGVTHPTCTSHLASLNVPYKKKQIIPGRIRDFPFKSESYTKKSLELDTPDRLKKKTERRTFLTMSNSQFTHLRDKKKVRSELFEALADIVPKSSFAERRLDKKLELKNHKSMSQHSLSWQNLSLMAVTLSLMFPVLLKFLLIQSYSLHKKLIQYMSKQ